MAPYGHEEIPTLKSVFEVPHLREKAKFLDTQCFSLGLYLFHTFLHSYFPDRMPHFIGNFLSERMYNNALGTKHANGSNVCCRFVDVTPSWQEKGEDGKSWIVSECLQFFDFILISFCLSFFSQNRKEAKTIIEICKKYKSERRQYRSTSFFQLWDKF